MLLAVSRGLLLLLLAVDWAEDTHCGTYIFSTTMASSLVDPLDTGFHDEIVITRITKESGSAPAIADFVFIAPSPWFALQEVRFHKVSHCREFLYLFMSLQQ